jgi:hypothetical protein
MAEPQPQNISKIQQLQQRSYNDCWQSNRKIFVALIAGFIAASIAMTTKVEIDPTMETLIVAAAPLILGYWWPMPLAKSPGLDEVVDWDFKSGIGFATIGTLIIYFVVQFLLSQNEVAATWVTAMAPGLTAGLRVVIAIAFKT